MDVYTIPEYDTSVYDCNFILQDTATSTYYFVVSTDVLLKQYFIPPMNTGPAVYKIVNMNDVSVDYKIFTTSDLRNWNNSVNGSVDANSEYTFLETEGTIANEETQVVFNIIEDVEQTQSINVYSLPADISLSDYPYNMVFYESGYGAYIVVFTTAPVEHKKSSSGTSYYAKNSVSCKYKIYRTDFNTWEKIKDSSNTGNFTICSTMGEVSQLQYNVVFNLIEDVTPAPTPTPEANYEQIVQAIMEVQKSNNDMVEAQHCANGLIGTVLFFFIFVWAEKRIKHAVRSFTGRGLDE